MVKKKEKEKNSSKTKNKSNIENRKKSENQIKTNNNNKNGKRSKKRKLSKKAKIIIAIVVIVIVLIIGLWGFTHKVGYPTVTEIIENKNKYLNEDVEVKGTVKKGSLDLINKTFYLTDGKNDLQINYTSTLPSNFKEGKEVLVKGVLREHPKIGLILEANKIEVGCASKY